MGKSKKSKFVNLREKNYEKILAKWVDASATIEPPKICLSKYRKKTL